MDPYTEDHSSSIDYEIEEEETSILLQSITPNRPSTVFFQYDKESTKSVKLIPVNRVRTVNWKEKKNKKFCVLYKAYKNIPDCISIPMKTNGMVRTKSFLKANLIWKLLKADKMTSLISKLNKYQRYNHFPTTWQLSRKDNLWRNYKIFQELFKEDYTFMPKTFVLPEEFEVFKEEYAKEKENEKNELWLIKPVASSRGRGIRLMTNIDNIPRKSLVAKYISNPHLINGRKYDLRLYVLITGFSPMKIYLYEEGLVRFASEEYNLRDESIHNKYIHLTNYSINKCSTHFDSNVNTNDECQGSKWSLSALKCYFMENNIDFSKVWASIKDVIVKSIIIVADEARLTMNKLCKHKNNLFELYGFDILIDENLKPWLIEINLNPSLNCETELDLKVKTCLLTDIFNIIGLIPYSHTMSMYKSNNTPWTINEYENGKGLDDAENVIEYSLDEFSRAKSFSRLFPMKENLDYYSKFFNEPGEDNLKLWEFLRTDKIKETLYNEEEYI